MPGFNCIVRNPSRWSFSFIVGPLHLSSIFPTSKEHRSRVQLYTRIHPFFSSFQALLTIRIVGINVFPRSGWFWSTVSGSRRKHRASWRGSPSRRVPGAFYRIKLKSFDRNRVLDDYDQRWFQVPPDWPCWCQLPLELGDHRSHWHHHEKLPN